MDLTCPIHIAQLPPIHFDLTVGLFSETRIRSWVLRLADKEESKDVDKGVQDHAAHDSGGISGTQLLGVVVMGLKFC